MRNALVLTGWLLLAGSSLAAESSGAPPINQTQEWEKSVSGTSGTLDGATFNIFVPQNWSGGLVMYCRPFGKKPGPWVGEWELGFLRPYLRAKFAVARSSFAENGWALAEGIRDTEALRKYFIQKYGVPKETYAAGISSGGLISIALVETFPDAYDGALSLGGVNAPVHEILQRREFDHLAVFDYYFPGVLPPLDHVPPGYSLEAEKIEALLKGQPEYAQALRQFSGLRTDEDLVKALRFFTESLSDVQRRSGGNPCDNRNTIYFGTPDDNSVNDKVKRYGADPKATDYVRRHYTVNGSLKRPVLSVHSTYDLYVPVWIMNAYSTITQAAGTSEWFVQQYVKRSGHCVFTYDEMASAFEQLRHWRLEGVRPSSGFVTVREE